MAKLIITIPRLNVERLNQMKNAPTVMPLGSKYETIAASQTTQSIGPTGAVGDYLKAIVVIPTNTTCGQITVTDGTTGIVVFQGGSTAVANLTPVYIPLGMTSVNGAWKVTTGTAESAIAIGDFT